MYTALMHLYFILHINSLLSSDGPSTAELQNTNMQIRCVNQNS